MMRPVADPWISAARGLTSPMNVQRVAAGATARYVARRRARMLMVTTIASLAFGLGPLLMRMHGADAFDAAAQMEVPSPLLAQASRLSSGHGMGEARGTGELVADASSGDAGFPRD